mmetsp:Transcript_40860/g.115688  ORF Transcript_40860/g.115688 Transcript_40860/m.115688 type:complete len:240 (-) Transcript_40860:29-748(-)
MAGARGEFSPQDLSNTAWSFAHLYCCHRTLMDSLSSAAIAMIAAAVPQDLANTAWACSKLAFAHRPFLAAISSAARRPIADFTTQNLSTPAWAFAALPVSASLGGPIFAEACRRHATTGGSDVWAHALNWVAWRVSQAPGRPAPGAAAAAAGDSRPPERALPYGAALSTSWMALWMGFSWQRDLHGEALLFDLLVQPDWTQALGPVAAVVRHPARHASMQARLAPTAITSPVPGNAECL